MAGIEQIYIDGSFCTEKPDPGDVDGYWIEPDTGVYDRLAPYWIDFEMIFVSTSENGNGECGRITVWNSSFIRPCGLVQR